MRLTTYLRFGDFSKNVIQLVPALNVHASIFHPFLNDSKAIPVSEIVLIEDAHTAIVRGCLSEGQLVEEDEEEPPGLPPSTELP